MAKADDQLFLRLAGFRRDPLACVRYSFPWGEGELKKHTGPRPWQAELLDTIGKHLRGPDWANPLQLAVASGHGVGKTALISQISHWAMSTCVDTKLIVTANTGTQLDTKTWPEMSKWFRMAINAHWFDVRATGIMVKDAQHAETWRADAITWSETNTEAFAGLHNQGRRIVVIYDEASAIADKVWEVTEGALTDEDTEIIWIAFGNPTQNTGRFRECFGRYKHRWLTKHIDSRTVEGTNKAQLQKWVEDYGEDSDFCRVRVRGEFPRAGSSQFISGEVVAGARQRKVEDQSAEWVILSCDVARFGDDQTVIGLRQGKKFTILDKLRGQPITEVSRRLAYFMREFTPRSTVIDGDGLGAGVVDMVREIMRDWLKVNKPCMVEEFHGGYTPMDEDMYYNVRAECWGRMRNWLIDGEIPNDPELDTDLSEPTYHFSKDNQIQLEKKEDMKKRGVSSPDIGDTLAMTFFAMPVGKTRDERVKEQQAAILDPMQLHFSRLGETERRKQAKKPLEYWQ